jgi:hypothetical protein
MKRLLALIIIFGLAKFAVSADVGTSAASFMKIDSSARPAALGGAFVAIADDATAIHYNPAGLGFLNQKQVSFCHNEWFESVGLESLSYAHPINQNWTLGVGMNYLFTDSVDETTSTGTYTGNTFSSSGGTVIVGMAGRFGSYFSFGVNAKGIVEKLASESGFAYGADAGFLFKKGFDEGFVSLGASVQNVGTKLKLYEDSFNIPLKYSGGIAVSYKYFTVTAVGDKARDSDTVIRTGIEFNSKELIKEARLALRAGYRTETSDKAGSGITAGIGIGVSNFDLDYAFVPMGELGSTHRVTISFKFGKVREDFSPAYKPKKDKTVHAYPEPEKKPEQLIIPELEQEVVEVEPQAAQPIEDADLSSFEDEKQTVETPEVAAPAEETPKPAESEGIVLTEDIGTPTRTPAESKGSAADFNRMFEKPRKIPTR